MNKFAYGLPKDLYNGMRVRPTMDTIADSIGNDPYRIKYPNREATFYMNSPQFLSLLQDTNVGLDEQSKRLEQQKMAQSRARLGGEGGAVEAARARTGSFETASSGEESVDMTSPQTLARMNLQARVRRRLEEAAREAEAVREQERRDYEYAQFLRGQQEEERRIAMEIARATAASSSSHPTASSSALATTSRKTYADLGLGPIAARFMAAMSREDPQLDIKYFTPLPPQQRLVRQGIVPQPPIYFTSTPFQLPPDVMTDMPPGGTQTKRPSTEIALPIPKAKARVGAGPVIEEAGEDEVPTTKKQQETTPTRKTGIKQDDEKQLKAELTSLLKNDRVYPIAEIRKKFKDKFPSIKEILALAKDGSTSMQPIDKAPRADIIAEYISGVAKKGKLKSEVKGLKEETATRKAAQAIPPSANYPPVGRSS